LGCERWRWLHSHGRALIEGRAGTFFGKTIQSGSNTGALFKMVVRETE
jgi:hypothetical protein